MKLRFTRTATDQLERVLADIAEHRPSGARNVQRRIRAVTALLLQYPYAGQVTTRNGIRRIVVTPYPYVFRYRIGKGEIVIRSVRPAARRPVA